MTWRKALGGILIAVAVLLFVVILSDGGAIWEAERGVFPPFSVESQDGSRVFIYDWRRFQLVGVFYNTRLPQLIYHISTWDIAPGRFYISQDLNHFAVVTPWSLYSRMSAVSFYSYGVLQASYFVPDLVRNSDSIHRFQLGLNEPSLLWEDYRRSSFNANTGRLRISTRDGLTYVFDLYSGEMIAGPIPGIPSRYRPFVIFGLFAIVCAGVGRKIRARKAENTQGYKGKTAPPADYGYHWQF
ncbi:MAG: hypothetical protein FWB75_08930 [Oscillospiraceae bacterium]|nr:hypothetical protein [Oscillospiraceae bacterium]